jgi:hypothetical protein
VSDLERLNIIGSPPGGIDQSDSPGRNTVYDAVNIDTYTGKWTSRDTFQRVYIHSATASPGTVKSVCDYIADPKYPDSDHSCALLFSTSSYLYEYSGGASLGSVYGAVDIGGGPGGRFYSARGLYRYRDGDTVKYTPAVVISGSDARKLYIYTQRFNPNGTRGIYEELVGLTDAADTLSDKTHLAVPPFGKYVVNFQDRIFVLNLENGANRIAFTGADIARAIPVNCWPASYNLDIGGPEAITGAAVYGDRLFIFKRDSIYMLSGSGDGGAWDIELYSDDQGAIDHCSITATPSGIYFASATGFWRISGSNVEDLSRGRVDKIIMSIQSGMAGGGAPIVFCDQKTHRVFFMVCCAGRTTASFNTYQAYQYDMILVYDYQHDAWTRWGDFVVGGVEDVSQYVSVPGISFASLGGAISSSPTYGFRSTIRYPEGEVVFAYAPTWNGASAGDALYDYMPLYTLTDGSFDKFFFIGKGLTAADQPVSWLIKTNEIREDRDFLARKMVLHMKKTGLWYLGVLLGRGREDIIEAIRAKSLPWVIITSRQSAAEQTCVGPGGVVTQFSGGLLGPVTIYSVRNCTPVFEDLTIIAASAVNKIKFSSAIDTTYFHLSDALLVVPAGESNFKYVAMTPNRGGTFVNASLA